MAESTADLGIVQKGHTPWNEQPAKDRLTPDPCSLHFPIEFPGVLAYAEDADEFVRQNCRDRTGWRRDEWAYGPLFICGKFPRFSGYFPRFSARNRANPVGPRVPGERFFLAGV
jgi:hypothetical protein